MHGCDGFGEGVGQGAELIVIAPHQALHDAGYPHCSDVDNRTDGRGPEMDVNQLGGIHLDAPEFFHHMVESACRYHGNPAQCAGVNMTYCPVSVVGERVDCLGRHDRTFEGGHGIESQGHDHETQDVVCTQFVPCARQGHHAVDGATPGRNDHGQGDGCTDGTGPVRQSGVLQMVSTQPYITEHQRPEVQYGQTVGEYGAVGLFGDEVVHDTQEARSQVETYRVVTPPPLNHGILNAGENGVGFEHADGDGQAVHHVQIGDHDKHAHEEPVGHIDVTGLALGDGHDEVEAESQPDDGDGQIDRPLQLGIFLGLGDAQWKSDDGSDDDQVPAPECKPGQLVAPQGGTACPLYAVESRSKQCTAAKCEDNRVGVQGTQTTESDFGDIEVQEWPGQFRCDVGSHQGSYY